ncbi:hypothetical protein M513_05476, partial [Trichuris suis]
GIPALSWSGCRRPEASVVCCCGNAHFEKQCYSDSEIVQMVVCQDKEDSGEEKCLNENEEDTEERISIDRL